MSHGATTGRRVLAGGRTSAQCRLGGALQKPPAATRAAKSSLGAGSEPSAGAGERARTHRHSLSRTELAVSRNSLGFFYGEEQRKGRCPFPCNPIPETYGCGRQASSLSCRQSSLETRLAEYENSCLLSRMVTRDISIVDKPGTFLMWYDRRKREILRVSPR